MLAQSLLEDLESDLDELELSELAALLSAAAAFLYESLR